MNLLPEIKSYAKSFYTLERKIYKSPEQRPIMKILKKLDWNKVTVRELIEMLSAYQEQGIEAYLDGDLKAICSL